ncbi:MAG: HDOD domain-containing protein [Gammaproteobacteria bacterium]|nr:HDOD domain-containing protein [Gammaproteobacteria bacterium]
MDHLFIARQPIYDRNKAVMGYELLYRNSSQNHANITDADTASCETILNTFMHIGIDNIAGSALAFINLPREFIVNDQLTPMFNEQAVLEILEDIKPDEAVINGIKRLKNEGYQIALDDFVFKDEYKPFVELADYIKFDLHVLSRREVIQQLEKSQKYNVKLIAEKIECHELYQFCYELGFDFFQGYFFCYPEMLKKKSLPSNKLVILNLIKKLQNPQIESNELEQILVQDITLTYKLLRYINSASFGLRREIDSIKDAIVIVGINNLKNWVSLIMMSKIIETKPTELIITGMIRGKMCELLAQKHHPEVSHQMFIIGLFSVLDALMDQPLIELLDTVILSTDIKLALLDFAGNQGKIYKYVLQYEKSNWEELNEADINANEFIQAYLTSVNWADQSMQVLLD